jgi:alkylation response protein AidB-like acyl-CoA dehydrogenase
MLVARGISDAAPELATRIVTGAAVVTIAWRGRAKASRSGNDLIVAGTIDRAVLASRSEYVLVLLDDGGAVLVPLAAAGVSTNESLSLSLETPEDIVTLQNVRVDKSLHVAPQLVGAIIRDGLMLQSAACLGSAEAALAMAVTHVTTRRQFGTALVANQAVRHMLARHKLGIEGLRSALERCFMAKEVSDLRARVAYVQGVETGIAVSEGAIQLHGGMGFTWDVPAHRYLRQVRSIGQRGGIDGVRDAIASSLIDANDTNDAAEQRVSS